MNFYLMELVNACLRAAPWLVLGTAGAFFLTRSSFGKALRHRLREGSVRDEELAALAGEVEQLRRDLGDVQERLDFTERLLAQQRQSLPPRAFGIHTPTPPDRAPADRRS